MNTFFFRIILLFFFGLFFQHSVFATHIVGGELLVTWTGSGNRYRVTLNKYLNEISVRTYGFLTNGTEDIEIRELGTNSFVRTLILPLATNNLLGSNSNVCVNPTVVQTSLQVYTIEMDLSFLDPAGSYYLTWDDCCRNQDIINLAYPTSEGVALYTSFQGGGIRNSTPDFLPLSNEFFCRNTMNVFNMGATDPDGDLLVYSLVTPRSAVFPSADVVWATGSSGASPIPGTVPFAINATSGMVTFNPSGLGIFAFGVKVDEFRNGIKIGEVRRDFQFNVQECTINNKPEIAFQNRAIKNHDTLTIQLKENKCFPIYVTDIDAANLFMNETLQITQSPSNTFPASAMTIPTQVNLTGFRPTAYFNMCLNPCLGGLRLNATTYYPHQVIITDDRCPIQYDTLYFTIKVEVSPNISPQLFIDPATTTKYINVNSPLTFNVYGTDADPLDSLSLIMYNGQRGMNFTNVRDSTATISSRFSWTPNCNDLNPGIYDFYFIVKDNSCSINPSDTIHQQIVIEDNDADFSGIEITNLITPNGDGLNDYYHVPGIPAGNCDKYFKGIEIYNRWGGRVFSSAEPSFKWDPKDSDGIYYFSVDLNYKIIKGWIEIIR